ncbi:low molecular weight phosphatase family protein [Marisediminicola sp. LYQ134]|uniref:arsenate reductase/protein-tyrosine-phosphatase family protein n=1 Tax=Marisediminicola sp. LYQ134 TaxID=3391061 RepID=UPI003983D984
MTSERFSVLVVCTGNICRSPVAEILLHQRLTASGLDVAVSSAGTHALVDHPITDQSLRLLDKYGEHNFPDSLTHRARQLTAPMVQSADLVLTATRGQRHEVVAMQPRASRRAFTLTQFARLLESVDLDAAEVDDLPSLLTEVAAIRGMVAPPSTPEQDDIVDPFRRDQAVYDEAGHAIDAAISTIVSVFVAAQNQPERP